LGPELVLLATDSDIADDRARPGQGADADDLSRGSFGSRDAFLGSIELPDGDYFVAVSNSSIAYNQMSQFSSANTTAPNLRVEPLDGFTRYSEDRFDNVAAETAFGPKAVAFTGSAADVVPWTLSDVTLFTARNNGTNGQFFYVNPLTGVYEANVSDTNTFRAIWQFSPMEPSKLLNTARSKGQPPTRTPAHSSRSMGPIRGRLLATTPIRKSKRSKDSQTRMIRQRHGRSSRRRTATGASVMGCDLRRLATETLDSWECSASLRAATVKPPIVR
jgi:hypothetical protein